VKAAVDAVMQWLYKPTILNGQAVEVMAPITVNFILN
jgi:protein TonB